MPPPFQFFDLNNKTLILTGVTRGIGKTLLPNFLSQGLKLILISRGLSDMENVCQEINANSEQVKLYECDLSNPWAVESVGKEILAKESNVDAILHNAAIDPRENFEDGDMRFWNQLFQVNLFAAIELTRLLLPKLRISGSGRIIFIGSIMEALGGGCMTGYVASKGAISGVTRSLAHELRGSRITVNCVIPGAVAVEKETRTKEADEMVISWQSVPRRLEPADLFGPICLLLSQAGGGITGQFITVDGGLLHPLADPVLQRKTKNNVD